MAKEKWLDPWSDAYYAHQRPLREATETKDSQKTHQAIHEHLPEMIAIQDAVATLPLPHVRSGQFGMLWDQITGIKPSGRLQIEREATLQSWNESIGQYQRELRKLESKLR